ncbi:MAG: succinate dehydrogenase cytochrome b subunit [Bryobacteraceae bacterium]|jgi:succinate dehydrogenase / fumarate reductase cytochrome b subunit
MGAIAIDTTPRKRLAFFEAYIGKKVVMAVTGAMLVLFIIGHLIGNLLIFLPAESDGYQTVYPINYYTRVLHAHPNLLSVVEASLIAVAVLHIWSSFLLWLQKRRARPVGYVKKDNLPASYASRTMMWGGPILAAFVVFHLLHLTTGSVGLHYQGPMIAGGEERYYTYENIIHGFRYLPVSSAYVVAMILLSMHLYHGAWSMFQSVGVSHPRYTPMLKRAAHIFAWIVAIGFISIPIAVLTGVVGSEVL